MRFVYLTSCVDSDAESIQTMVDEAEEVTCRRFREECNSRQWERDQGYLVGPGGKGLRLYNDWAVRYFKSRYRSAECYYVVHSAIEYIFVKEEDIALAA